MFCASYKDTHPSKYLECGNLRSYGYKVRWNGGSWSNSESEVTSDYNQIYIKPSTSRADEMWLASPSGSGPNGLMSAYNDGRMKVYNYSGSNAGLRPLVCLKSSVQLEKQSDGTYQIVH